MSIPKPAENDSGASMKSAFSWSFPGSPIRINIALGLISRLRAELDQPQNLANITSGAEVGGVLLGHQETPTTLEIDDYVWVSSEDQPGSRYHLDPSQLKRLRLVYTFAVGYFRTQPEDNLHLRDEEISFVGKHFRDPSNVVLLIHASPQRYTAGFFFWMPEGVFAPISFMDFPLDTELLRPQAEPCSTDARVTQSAEEVEMPLLLPASNGKDAAALAENTSTSSEEPIPKPAPLMQIEPAETTPPRTAAASKKRLVRVSQRMLIVTGLAFAVLPLAGLSVFLLWDGWLPGSRQKAPATVAAFPLQLEVEAKGDGLDIRWNPHSAPIIQAREGHLVILEGDRGPRDILLDQQLLTSGHLYYRSSAERLRFQLEIVENSGRVFRESVLALSSEP